MRSRSEEQLAEEVTDRELSGTLIAASEPGSPVSEAYRTLRTSLLYSRVDAPPKVVVVTSPGPGEGKSTTCANLGVVLAQADKKTLVIDCDLRRPNLHNVFGLRNLTGLVDALVGENGLQEVWQALTVPNLSVVTTGPIPPNPAELLGSNRFAELIYEARSGFDYVLIDAPPVGRVSDPMILAMQGDGVLLVIDSRKTRKSSARQAVRHLEVVGAKIIGSVMNNMKGIGRGYYQNGPY